MKNKLSFDLLLKLLLPLARITTQCELSLKGADQEAGTTFTILFL